MKSYQLIDSGEGEKLEQIGDVSVRRPDPEALWPKGLTSESGGASDEWNNAQLTFDRVDSKTGIWRKKGDVPDAWHIEHGGFVFVIRPTSFKHVGIFPEQESNWHFIQEQVAAANQSGEPVNVLNLFGYTGGATLAAAKAGAEVTHVDASKPVVEWAKENAEHNNLEDKPIRWLIDDALQFVKREVKRGKKYDGIVMDPPAFGRGPDGEVWKIEENFLELFNTCAELLSEKPIFFIISGYASGYSALAFGNCLKLLEAKYGGSTETLELTLKESSARHALLPAGVTARWKS
jgi:23S rRNA (cytosine1962-C5)-methyltransferase